MKITLKIVSTLLVYISSLSAMTLESQTPGLTISLTPDWQPIGHGKATEKTFGGAWICAGTITIKKRINETLSLTEAVFRWNGPRIKDLHASLYRKNSEPFLAIEDNVVSDGIWRQSQQLLSFTFSNKQILDPITTFYLVLTVPSALEPILKKGGFELLATHLPAQVQLYLENKPLSLVLSDLVLKKNTRLAHATKR